MSFAYGREKSLPLVYRETAMRESRTNEISVFVDESGSFEPDEESSGCGGHIYVLFLIDVHCMDHDGITGSGDH